MKIDLHCHTCYSSDALSSPYNVIKEALKKGLDGIAITDHDTTSGWNDAIIAAKELNAILILGEEIKSSKGDILGLFLQEEIKMKGYSPEEVIKEIHRQGGLAIIPHPFYKPGGFKDDIKKYNVDGIEVFNAKRPISGPDKKAFNFARQNNLIMTAGSDCHNAGACGYAYVECGAKDLNEFKEKLVKKQVKIHGKKAPLFYAFTSLLKKLQKKRPNESSN